MTDHDDDITGTPSASPAGKDRKRDALADVIAAYPVGSIVASAAVGAGLMALLSAVSHRAPPPPRRPIDRAADAASQSYADLQVQLTQLIRNMSALLPGKAEARQAAQSAQATARTAAQEVGDKATQAWGRLADEAQQVFRDAAPGMQRAGQAVREHPVLASVAVGALGALAAALAMNREAAADEPPPAPSEPETPPPM